MYVSVRIWYQDFGRRLARDIKRIVDNRMNVNLQKLGHLAHTTQVRGESRSRLPRIRGE